jgi:glycosyltransferase involved in cell wall biosynthesis
MTAATVIIVTRERKADLRRAIESTLGQTAKPEVLVIDDASTDGTPEMVQKEFPDVRLHSAEEAAGYIHQRNRGASMASGQILFSIDDDATFSSPYIVEKTLNGFDHPRVGAVAIPFVNVNTSSVVHQRAPSGNGIYATYSFIGTAHALRRDLFTELSGYRASLVHQGEEEDYCIRMLNAGYVTRCGNSDPIHHFESPRRSFERMDYYGARNKILFAWQNIPFPQMTSHLSATTVKTLVYSLRPDRFWTRFRGVAAAYALCASGDVRRYPVSQSTYRLSRRMKMQGPTPLEEIAVSLPNLFTQSSCGVG